MLGKESYLNCWKIVFIIRKDENFIIINLKFKKNIGAEVGLTFPHYCIHKLIENLHAWIV
jgi:hypothetical protein